MPATSQTTRAMPGEGTLVSTAPGDVKTPLPMTMPMTIPNASVVPRLRLNVPPPFPPELSGLSLS